MVRQHLLRSVAEKREAMLGGGYAKAGVLGVRQNARNLLTTQVKPRAIRWIGLRPASRHYRSWRD